MSENTVQNSVRYVVSSEHAGGVIPGKRSQMWRDVYLKPGASVGGGVFGNNVLVEGGDIEVKGAVYARGGIKVSCDPGDNSQQKSVDFRSTVSAGDSLHIDEHFTGKSRFFADIFSKQINISNAFIRGNLYADSAIIRNSVILGGVFCRNKLTLKNTILSTFRAGKVVLEPELMLFYPFALAEEPIDIDFSAKSLSFSSLMELAKQLSTKDHEVVMMDQDDVIRISETEDNKPRCYHMLSLGGRILDLEELKIAFQDNVKYLKMISLGDHLSPAARKKFENKELENLENVLFEMLINPPAREVSKKTPMDSVAGREGVTDFMKSLNLEDLLSS